MQQFLYSLTPDVFNTLIIAIIIIGLAMAAVRLIRDFTRPMPPRRTPPAAPPPDKDTLP